LSSNALLDCRNLGGVTITHNQIPQHQALLGSIPFTAPYNHRADRTETEAVALDVELVEVETREAFTRPKICFYKHRHSWFQVLH
jgi:hypothetical protein